MFKTLANAMKVKEIRMRILFTFLMLLVVRFGSLLPIPGVDTSYFNTLMSGDGSQYFAEFIVVDIVSHTAGVTRAGADNGDVA